MSIILKYEERDITDENIEEYLAALKGLYLLDFWAEWCSPCQILLGTLQKIIDADEKKVAEESDVIINLIKLDIEKFTNYATKVAIKGVPTLKILKDGEIIATNVGGLDEKGLKKWIEENV